MMSFFQQCRGDQVVAGVFALLILTAYQLPSAWASENDSSGDDLKAGPLPDNATAGVTVAIETTDSSVIEGAEATFRFRRTDASRRMEVAIELGGTATHGVDYSLEGFASFAGDRGSLVFAEGQQVVVIAVDITDDIQAEALESISLGIIDNEGNIASKARLLIAPNDTVVTTTADRGEGSLRQAVLNAERLEGPDTITFDSVEGPFAEPQTILLESSLPAISGEVTIDGFIPDRLWKATGVTLSGGGEHRVLEIAEDGDVMLRNFTISDGRADTGGGLLNMGELVVEGMLFANNSADTAGGGLANSGGSVTIINTTFSANTAGRQGGGMANISGEAVVTNSTFSENVSAGGAGLFSSGTLRLNNSLLARNQDSLDCQSTGEWDAASTSNHILTSDGCQAIVSRADPRLGKLGRYNGPTMIYPLNGDSPAINLGDNASAVDHEGKPLVWDQRGNGDPRFVGGITDIGAFEHQRHPWLVVDTPDDSSDRACTRMRTGDCSLRGAIQLANAAGKAARIRFDPGIFVPGQQRLLLDKPLPVVAVELHIDAGEAGEVVIETADVFPLFRCEPYVHVELIGVTASHDAAGAECRGKEQ